MAYKVELYVYDLSQGMAAMLSPMLIGKRIEGLWHTSIVIYGREYFFGSHGVESCNPGSTALGKPLKVVKLGETQIPYTVFIDYLSGLGESTFSGGTYHLFKHNCNNFSEELAHFLCGTHIPKHIVDLPNEVLQTKLGPTIESLLKQLEQSARPLKDEQNPPLVRLDKDPSPELLQLHTQIEEARSAIRRNNDANKSK